MKRFLSLLAATAVCAAVAAAITLPAGASDEPTSKEVRFVAGLRDHGLAIPADTTGDAIKGWLVAHDNVDAAVQACRPRDGGRDVKVVDLLSCLRAHQLDPPTDPVALKQWMAAHAGDAGLTACGFDEPRKPEPGGPCSAPAPAAAAAAKRE